MTVDLQHLNIHLAKAEPSAPYWMKPALPSYKAAPLDSPPIFVSLTRSTAMPSAWHARQSDSSASHYKRRRSASTAVSKIRSLKNRAAS